MEIILTVDKATIAIQIIGSKDLVTKKNICIKNQFKYLLILDMARIKINTDLVINSR